ncbi:ATP-binding protein, partial [Salmonella enterica]|uniref:ATP-binding protein n=1 Tax=Salmonella enterica TaxID=28901 RepID=UPI00329A1F6A
VAVDISDTGIGISEDYLPNLFTAFTQEEQGYSRKYQGNGVGLALVKKYSELNEAEVEVRSEKGKGTTFTVTFKPLLYETTEVKK